MGGKKMLYYYVFDRDDKSATAHSSLSMEYVDVIPHVLILIYFNGKQAFL